MLGIPKEKGGIKRLFIADDGKLLLEGDQKQCEIRALGALANDTQMIDDFGAGKDFHGIARDRMYHKGYDKKNYTHQEVLDAKTVVFGPIYGRQPPSTARMLKCSVEEAYRYIRSIWDPYPIAEKYMADRIKEVHETGEIRCYFGHHRHFGLLTSDNIGHVENQARNVNIQSTASYINLSIMTYIFYHYDHDLILPLIPIHDAVLYSIDAARKNEARAIVEDVGNNLPSELLHTKMPFAVDIEMGRTWSGEG